MTANVSVPIPKQCELLQCTRPAVKDRRCAVHALVENVPHPKEWIPHTPNGTAMLELAGESEATAWRNLMVYARRYNFPSNGRSSLELKGYSVRKRNNGGS